MMREISGRENLCWVKVWFENPGRGSVRLGSVHRGKVSRRSALGNCQSGNCPVKELSYNR